MYPKDISQRGRQRSRVYEKGGWNVICENKNWKQLDGPTPGEHLAHDDALGKGTLSHQKNAHPGAGSHII